MDQFKVLEINIKIMKKCVFFTGRFFSGMPLQYTTKLASDRRIRNEKVNENIRKSIMK